MWNTNGTSVDLLLKSSSISGATRLLVDANVSYSIIIDNLQKDIEAENPSKDIIQQLQNRKGELCVFIYIYYTNKFFNPHTLFYHARNT